MEWGSKAYDLMWELKALFDPNFVLNPGVVLNKVCTCPYLPFACAGHILWKRSQAQSCFMENVSVAHCL